MATVKNSLNFDDICILHLSDLHITHSVGRMYAASLDLLIKDISMQLSTVDELILVVSGDIVDKGKYDKKNSEAIFVFFDNLYKALSGKIKALIMVPGNHDKVRDKINELITIESQKNGEFLGEQEWQYQLNSYFQFIEIYNKLLQKYHPNSSEIDNTFGVQQVNINGYCLIFVRIDTAWCSCSNDDSYRLRLGKYQSEKLIEKYQACFNLQDEKNTLTIGISHFPINYLNPEEEMRCNSLFLSKDKLNLDMLLCGHVHNVSLTHSFNHNHSLLTLITGIGDDGSHNNANHRYSIYSLNPVNNSCDIIMRKSGQNCYNYDYSIYTGKDAVNDNKLIYPIKVRESHSFIKMFSPEQINSKSKFLDSELLSSIPKVSVALNNFIQSMSTSITFYKAKAYDDITGEWMEQIEQWDTAQLNTFASKLYDYLFLDSKLSSEDKNILNYKQAVVNFSGFLMDICSTFNRCLQKIFSQDVLLRTHFRLYDEKSDKYVSFKCQTNESANSSPPKPIKWTKIMQVAFNSKAIIQCSANPKLNEIKTEWDDFITIVPQCIDNLFEKILNEKTREHEQRPCLTFGLSIKNSKQEDSNVLAILSFLKIDEVLTKIIDEYLQIFDINLKQSLSELLKEIKEVKAKAKAKAKGKGRNKNGKKP